MFKAAEKTLQLWESNLHEHKEQRFVEALHFHTINAVFPT